MKKTILRTTSILALSAVLACGAWAQEKIAKLGHAMPVGHPQATAMKKFAELVATNTDNRVKVQVFDGAQLGGDDKMLQAVQAGTQEFYVGGVAPLSGRIKTVQIFDFPFLFQSKKEVDYVLNGPVGKKMLDSFAPTGLVGLAWSEAGFRNLSNKKRPIQKAEDISGLKVRVMQNPVALESWKALGANAVPMSFSEVFTALETGALDAQENPLPHMYANKMFEVQKYITLTNHVYTPVALVASKKFMDGLSSADQAAIQKAATTAATYQRQLIDEDDKAVVGKLKSSGMSIEPLPAAELAKLQQLTKPVVDKYTPIIGAEFVKEFYTEIAKARAVK
jgi:tripartite ATP-independent transporter DctP family solute receptor